MVWNPITQTIAGKAGMKSLLARRKKDKKFTRNIKPAAKETAMQGITIGASLLGARSPNMPRPRKRAGGSLTRRRY